MNRSRALLVVALGIVAGSVIAVVALTAWATSSSQGQQGNQSVPTSFTAAVPCTVSGQAAQCATVNGIPVIITGSGYKPLTAKQVEQVEDSVPSDAASAYEGTGSQQDPARDPAVTDPEPPAPEHYTEPDPVEVEPHPVIVDAGK